MIHSGPSPDLALLARAFDRLPAGIVVTNRSGEVVFANAAFSEGLKAATGRPLVAGRLLADQFPPALRDAWSAALEEAVVSGQIRGELQLQAGADGAWMQYHCELLDGPGGGYLMLQVRNITRRRQAERRLLSSEHKFRSILENSAAPMLVLDAAGTVMMLNPESERLFSRSYEDLFARPLPELASGLDELLKNVPHGSGGAVRFGDPDPLTLLLPGGFVRYAAGSVSRFFIEGEPFYLAVLIDITNRVAFEAEIRARNAQLHRIAQMQAHDVRRPLANILGLTDLVADDPHDSELVAALRQESRALDQVIRAIIEASSDTEDA